MMALMTQPIGQHWAFLLLLLSTIVSYWSIKQYPVVCDLPEEQRHRKGEMHCMFPRLAFSANETISEMPNYPQPPLIEHNDEIVFLTVRLAPVLFLGLTVAMLITNAARIYFAARNRIESIVFMANQPIDTDNVDNTKKAVKKLSKWLTRAAASSSPARVFLRQVVAWGAPMALYCSALVFCFRLLRSFADETADLVLDFSWHSSALCEMTWVPDDGTDSQQSIFHCGSVALPTFAAILILNVYAFGALIVLNFAAVILTIAKLAINGCVLPNLQKSPSARKWAAWFVQVRPSRNLPACMRNQGFRLVLARIRPPIRDLLIEEFEKIAAKTAKCGKSNNGPFTSSSSEDVINDPA